MAASISLAPNYHTIGVTVSWAGADDADRSISTIQLEYKESSSGTWLDGFRMQRISALNQAFSTVFWLTPGTSYDIRATISDPGDSLNGEVLTATASTRYNPVQVETPVRTVNVSNVAQLQAAIADATAGDDIVCAAGTYYLGEETLSASGTASRPITIRAATGATVVFSGKYTATLTWSLHGTFSGKNMYKATTSGVSNIKWFTWDDQFLAPAVSLADAQNFCGMGISTFWHTSNTLYVHLLTGANPSGETVETTKYNHCFKITGSNWHIRDIEFEAYGRDIQYACLNVYGSNVVVDGCTFTNTVGVQGINTAHLLTVQNCTFTHDLTLSKWKAMKGRLPSGLNSHVGTGIRMRGNSPGPRRLVARWNTFSGFDGLQYNVNWDGSTAHDTDIYENTFNTCYDDGLEVDFYGVNVRIFSNRFGGSHNTMSLARTVYGPVYVIDNVVWKVGNDEPDLQTNTARVFKFGANKTNSVGVVLVYHNTFYSTFEHTDWGACTFVRTSTGSASFPQSFDGVDIRNNIIHGADYDYRMEVTSGWYTDYNCYPNLRATWDGVSHTSMTTFQSAGADRGNGIEADPLFVDAASYDFTLDTGSPCIGTAETINGINSHLSAGVRNIGALTTVGSTPAPEEGGGEPSTGEALGAWTNDSANTSEYIRATGADIDPADDLYLYASAWSSIHFFYWDGYTTDESNLMAYIVQTSGSHHYAGRLQVDNGGDPADLQWYNRAGVSTTLSAQIDSGTWCCAVVVNDGGDDGSAITLYLYSWDGVNTWTLEGTQTGDEGDTNANAGADQAFIYLGNRPSGGTAATAYQEVIDGSLALYGYVSAALSQANIETMLSEGPISYLEGHANTVMYWDWDGTSSQANTGGSGSATATVSGGNWSSATAGPTWPGPDPVTLSGTVDGNGGPVGAFTIGKTGTVDGVGGPTAGSLITTYLTASGYGDLAGSFGIGKTGTVDGIGNIVSIRTAGFTADGTVVLTLLPRSLSLTPEERD